jgi:hypothetical protein
MKLRIIAVGLVLFLLTGMLAAQSDRATITGTVKDASGAVVPDVQVTATNDNTNVQTTVRSNGLGLYTILNLPIGQYHVTFAKDGFKTFERKGITLLVSQVAQINAALEVGTKSETVTITEDAPLLQTQTTALSTNLTNSDVADLPLSISGSRGLSNFMFAFVPGVEGSDYDSHIMGSQTKTKEVMIDGTSAVAQIGGYIGESQPPFESIQEFQVDTTGIRADERSGGGVFRYTMKSGTNKWHGSGFLFGQNEGLNANSSANKYHLQQCLAGNGGLSADICHSYYDRPTNRMYDYGGSFGGPIVKNKTFFYAAFERWTFENYGLGQQNSTVPTTAFLNGDFSALLDTNTVLGTDSAGNTVYKGAIVDPTTGNVFVGNQIPTNRFSAVSQKMVDILKQQYQPLNNGLVRNNAMVGNNSPWYHIAQFSIKLDHNISDKHHLNGSFIWSQNPRLLADQGGVWSPGSTDGGPLANAYNHHVNAPSARISDSYAISNTLLNVFNITFNRFHNPSSADSQKGNWPSTLGLGDFGAGNFPIILFQGVNSDQHRFAANGQQVDEDRWGSQFNDFYTANTFLFGDNLSWVKGRHTLKFGAEFRAQQFNSHGDYGVPTFVFDPAQTAWNGNGATGFGFASFLLGQVNQASVSMPNQLYGRRKGLAFYAQDDFKVTEKLTLNLDLRWDWNGRYHEKNGRWSNFNTTMMNPATGRPGALEFATSGDSSFEKKQYWLNFAPHVGAAYQITPKTVARASYGLFYVPLNLNTWGGVPYGFNPGFVQDNRYMSAFNWDSGYPGHAVDVGKDPNFTKWGMVSIDPRALEMGNTQQWMVGVQRELSSDMRLDVSFTQSHSYHLHSGYLAGNQPNLADYTAMMNAGTTWNWVTAPGFSGFQWAAIAPFPTVAATWGPLFYVDTPLGNADYKSLQFQVTKRTKSGLSLQASYNLSQSHGDADNGFSELWWAGPLQNVYNLQNERHVISPFDQTHIVKGYVNYDLPFGKGKKFMNSAPTAVDAIAGGWTISTGFHYNSGTPIHVGSNYWYPGINNIYANYDPSCKLNTGSFNNTVGGTYFNPACFSNPAYGGFGNAPTYLSNLRNFGFASEDISVHKNFVFGQDGRMNLNVRFDMFNAFNRRGFAGPITTAGDPNFGKVVDAGGIGGRFGQFGARFTF